MKVYVEERKGALLIPLPQFSAGYFSQLYVAAPRLVFTDLYEIDVKAMMVESYCQIWLFRLLNFKYLSSQLCKGDSLCWQSRAKKPATRNFETKEHAVVISSSFFFKLDFDASLSA